MQNIDQSSEEQKRTEPGPARYKGLCARFRRKSKYLVPSVAIFSPQILYYTAQQVSNIPDTNQNLFIATTIGVLGLFAGGGSHILCNKFLYHTGVNRKQGSNITQKIQIATYAAIIAAGMCFANTEADINSDITNQAKTNTSQDFEI